MPREEKATDGTDDTNREQGKRILSVCICVHLWLAFLRAFAMGYISNSDIERRLGTTMYIQLTDDSGAGVADELKVDEAREGAEGEANSYLAARYQTPVDLSAHPELAAVLTSFVLDLAEYRLHNRRPPVPADIVRKRVEAVTWLGNVATGVVHLPAMTTVAADSSRAPLAEAFGPERVFTRESMANT